MYNYIKSPINGDIFPITSKSAKLIIKKYLQKLYGGSDTKDKICIINIKDNICDTVFPIYKSNLSEITDNLQVKKNRIKKMWNNLPELVTKWNNNEYVEESGVEGKKVNKDIPNGAFGKVNKIILKKKKKKKDKKDRIYLLEKVPINTQQILDEMNIKGKYENALKQCSNIVPFKIINDKFYMLKGHGTLADLINSPTKKISIYLADQIIKCLAETLVCLYKKNVYYFDIKAANVVYICTDQGMFIWLIDLGSAIPTNVYLGLIDLHQSAPPSYICTYPHPLYNLKLLDSRVGKFVNYITPQLIPFTFEIYSYQLSILFYDLLRVQYVVHNTGHNYIRSEKVLNSIHSTYNEISYKLSNLHLSMQDGSLPLPDTDKEILQNYHDIYNSCVEALKINLDSRTGKELPPTITTPNLKVGKKSLVLKYFNARLSESRVV